MTNLTKPNNMSSMKYAPKLVPGLADVGVPHVAGDGPRTSLKRSGGVRKKFQVTNLTMPNKSSLMNYALKSVPGVADVGDPHGCEDGPRTPARGSRSKKHTHHADQHAKLKG